MKPKHIFTNEICVFFLTTLNEYYNGTLKEAVESFSKNCNSKYKFDLMIYFDRKPTDADDINNFLRTIEFKYKNINKTKFSFSVIPEHQNFYDWNMRNKISLNDFPMGASHGVNEHFYMTLNSLFDLDYNNFLLLEADTMPMCDNWFDVALQFTRNNTDFLIAGSKYKGKNREWVEKQYWGGHLNGVAIYKNCEELKFDLEESKKFLIKLIKENPELYNNFMNYDVAIYLYYKETCENDIEDYLYDTDFITNISDNSNKDVEIEDVLKEFPHTRILHRKGLYCESN